MDGFISGPANEIDWLFHDQDYGFTAFFDAVDTTIMGFATYAETKKFPGFPFPGKVNYVLTRNHADEKDARFIFLTLFSDEFFSDMKNETGGDIWLVGGGEINSLFLAHDLIDRIILSYHPVILGTGKPLFPGAEFRKKFTVTDTHLFPSGLFQVTFDREPGETKTN
jgi:dihydrofolate reductase